MKIIILVATLIMVSSLLTGCHRYHHHGQHSHQHAHFKGCHRHGHHRHCH